MLVLGGTGSGTGSFEGLEDSGVLGLGEEEDGLYLRGVERGKEGMKLELTVYAMVVLSLFVGMVGVRAVVWVWAWGGVEVGGEEGEERRGWEGGGGEGGWEWERMEREVGG